MSGRSVNARAVRGALLVAGAVSLCAQPAFFAPAASQQPLQRTLPTATWGSLEGVTPQPRYRQLAARAPRPAMAVVAVMEMRKPEKMGKFSEAFLTAFSTAAGVFVCSVLAKVLSQPLWVPPFGAVALGYAAEATAAAKKGQVLNLMDFGPRNIKNIASTFFGAIITVVITSYLGPSPFGRAVAIASVGLFMGLSTPLCGFFPSAGGLAGLYLNEVLNHGPLALPGYMAFKFALAPCVAGCTLMLVVTRIATAVMAKLLRFRFRLAALRPEPELFAA